QPTMWSVWLRCDSARLTGASPQRRGQKRLRGPTLGHVGGFTQSTLQPLCLASGKRYEYGLRHWQGGFAFWKWDSRWALARACGRLSRNETRSERNLGPLSQPN